MHKDKVEVQFCRFGCKKAEESYGFHIIESLNDPHPPVASAIHSTSILIKWELANSSAVRYILQWRYRELREQWIYTEVVKDATYNLTKLHPYTEYVFRVMWIITDSLYKYSPESRSYRTKPYGVPSSSPLIIRIESPSPTSVVAEWKPPMFPNGPLIGYHIELQSGTEHFFRDANKEQLCYSIHPTKPGTTYRFSIAARNTEGIGPVAIMNVSTLPQPELSESLALWLSRQNALYESKPGDLEAMFCSRTDWITHSITGISGDVRKKELYISEGPHIWALPVGSSNHSRLVYRSDRVISDLSVDWLYSKLYFVIDQQVLRCDVKNCSTEVVVTLTSFPVKTVADPFSGYLFIGFMDGLYRMALPGMVLEAENKSMEPIVANTSLLTFSLNPSFKRLIYISDRGGTVHYIFLDGTETDKNSRLPFDTASIQQAVHSCTLWVLTNGRQVFIAEEHEGQLYPTEVSVESCNEKDGSFDNLFLWDLSTQPLPVPLHEPTHLQVVLGFNSAALTWRKPRPGAGLGPNAWQQWSYDIIIVNGNISNYKEGINSTNITLYGLNSSTVYTFRIRASSPGGKGPWSSIFQGTTLKEGANPYVLAGNELGTWKVFLDKFTNENMLPSVKNAIDLDWLNSSLYWTNSTGFAHVTSLVDSDSETEVMQGLQNVGALAVDWISNTLYWADSEKNNIFRMPLDSEVRTKVRDVAGKVQDLQLDPLQGYLYWTTAQSVEYARMNGDQAGLIEELPNFSGKQISGLTLDFDLGALCWLTQDNIRLEINQAELIRKGNRGTVKRIFSSDSLKTSQHMLQYYCGKLVWINENGGLQIVEMGKKQTVHISSGVPFTAFTVVHQKPLPDGFSNFPVVIPNPVPASSFKIQGNSSRICITWESASNVNYGILYYRFESRALLKVEDLSTPHYCLSGLEPFTEFDVAVKPYTFWGSATETQVTLYSPEAAPSAPENPRIFVNLRKNILLGTVNMDVEFRWNVPAQTNGVLRGYTVYYTTENCSGTLQDDTLMNVTADITTFKLTDADPEKTYCVQVEGFTNAGSGRRTHVRMGNATVTGSAPYLLAIKDRMVTLLDMDNQKTIQKMPVSAVTHMGYILQTQRIYYLTENLIMSTAMDGKHKTQLIESILCSAPKGMTVDWIGQKLYVVLDKQEDANSSIYVLDLELQGTKLEKLLSNSQNIYSIGIYPQKSLLFWTQSVSGNIILESYSLIDRWPRPLIAPHLEIDYSVPEAIDCNCTAAKLQLDGNLAVDTTDSEPEKLFFTTHDGQVWASDLNGCICWKKINSTGATDFGATSLTVNSHTIYWITQAGDQSTVYMADKASGNVISEYQDSSVVAVMAFSEQSQPYPDPQCLIPKAYSSSPEVLNKSDTSLTIYIPPVEFSSACSEISKPTPTYILHYAKFQDNDVHVNCTHGIQCYKKEVQTNITELKGLQSYTRYLMQVSVKNHYGDMSKELGPPAVNWTWFGVPSAPRLVEVLVLSDRRVKVSWAAPLEPKGPMEQLRYQVQYNGNNYWPAVPARLDQLASGRSQIELANLKGGTEYWFQVLSFPPVGGSFSRSETVLQKTFQTPQSPHLLSVGNTTATMLWQFTTNHTMEKYWFEISQDTSRKIWKPAQVNCSNHGNFICIIRGLHPSRTYALRTVVTYKTNISCGSAVQVLETRAGVPGKPGTPYTIHDDINWIQADDNGNNITHYILQAQNSQNDTGLQRFNNSDEWITLYQGPCSNTICTWHNQHFSGFYRMRVVAINGIGKGEFSDISGEIIMKLYEPRENLVLLVLGPVCATVVMAVFCISIAVYAQKAKHNKLKEDITTLRVNYNPDLELALIRDMNASVIQTNIWYTSSCLPTQVELESLPLFPREKLTLLNFLGSGAFGEVFEGKAEDILGPGSGDVTVAVKALRKGATDHEKSEFLKEAYLMSHFDHAHIVKLLGVCLLNEPQFLLLELMKGRDLLSYLRGARGFQLLQPLLCVGDLIDICLDVAKGCTYLEKMHFVHRDLAARNCLVSMKEYNCTNRKVKIGDFGLARDIYKNDYYRKEGEGLLPVRWMAPESLIDGLFTNQSDVWSFGILMWEVMTLGQQPYPARTNLEVLHFVRTGGRLEQPNSCPDNVHQLMLKCWTREPHKRPSFQYIESCLEHLKSSPQGSQNALVHYNDDYRNSDISQGIVNQAFEGEQLERQKSDDNATGITLTSVANEEGDGLHYVMYHHSPDICSKVDSLEMRMSMLQEGSINYSYVTSAEDEESVINIGYLDDQGDYDVCHIRQSLPLRNKIAVCAAPDSVNKDNRRYSLHRTSKHLPIKSQPLEDKTISITPVPTEFQNSRTQLSLDGVTVPFLFYTTVDWENTPSTPTKEKYNSGIRDVVSSHVSEVNNIFTCSENQDGGLESKGVCEKNTNSLVINEKIEEASIIQNNTMTAASNLEESVSI
ncbi:proto-oncogene tyrosine-protein kinase ROS [Heterodontus francisci]|uniref:proto-oncogene tyrosine-protein kinase ROS n=1 Tax=Heterodontus francisci TaxID=7792 RepID=UPI00355BFBC1